ncbi:VOC family protein [Amycolatopsis sp. 195334CR]|uniref:VOC family protein n=1 Tax=Amycolatopsis sp. 195334CR TaxID=2814588 RepID=UPI001A8C9909|nr:VOC family protein [Amycolatopsis sp. 195334CR]MBN6035646.1 VOC family protein [Amycolatopsis sp. 195334CR]
MTTSATLHGYFGYRDAQGALDWFQRAFGFEQTMCFSDGHGGIGHAELRYGPGVSFTLFTDEAGYDRAALKGETVGHGLWIRLGSEEEVDALYAKASAAGAKVIWPPAATEWGTYRFRVHDPEGYEWTFSTYDAG